MNPTAFKLVALIVAIVAPVAPAPAAPADVAHPFILWTPAEAKSIRQRIETEPWAAAEYDRLLKQTGLGQPFRNLFRYVVMGDLKAGENEKNYLLGIIGTHPKTFEKLEHGGRHYDCYLDALRYDAVYDLLTAEQRQKIEETFRAYIAYQLEDKKFYSRTSWLPNMQWPRPMAAHLMAVSLRDEAAIRSLINGNGGWKWYFDEYIADGQFYMEEFGKHYSMIGEMLLFCRGLERLGLNETGYGYTGKGGATMRRYLESIINVGWPRTEFPGGLPRYAKITMGDAKGGSSAPGFAQHAFVEGNLAGQSRPNSLWSAANMNGRDHRNAKVEKLLAPQWFEIAHAKWPDGRFDYFLAQMRSPGQDRYIPTLFWGIAPVDPAKVMPPPAPSYVAPERGFAFLRANQSPSYWESSEPAVALQFATLYVHYVSDCFSLLGYHAFNRPLYVNRAISAGYNGGPYDFHVRSHCGVVVDSLQAQPIGPVPHRSDFQEPAKYVHIHTAPPVTPYTGSEVRSTDQPKTAALQVYTGVDMSRTLVLTRDYLFDVFWLTSDKPRLYHWLVHPLGDALPDDPTQWTPSDELQKTLFDVPSLTIAETRRFDAGDRDWALTTQQNCYKKDPADSIMGPDWYNRQIGVRVAMLGEPGTAVFHYRPPVAYGPGTDRSFPADKQPTDHGEAGGVSIAVTRNKPTTVFVALHEPFENGRPRIKSFARIAQTDHAVAARVTGPFHDIVLARFDTKPDEPVKLDGGDESWTFARYGWIRIAPDVVTATGGLTSLRLRVAGNPKFILNGQPQQTTIVNGILQWN